LFVQNVLLHKKKIDTFVHPKYSSFSPSKNGGRNHHKTKKREEEEEELGREQERRRRRTTENHPRFELVVLVLFVPVSLFKKMSEEEPKTEKQLIRQAEKERKKKEKLEKELKKKREGLASSSGGGGSVVTVHASQTPPVHLDAVSGTRDFFPEEFRLQTWLFEKFRKCGLRAGFEEYDAPVLERQELYKRKAGEEITQQMYSFVDKDGVEVTLRPEMTPTLARMVLSRGASMILPLKWFSIPQCWRFEATQRGRKREHYQWNMDIIGCKEITAEVELLSAAVEFFKSCGITSADVGIKVNSRKVMQSMLTINDVPDEIFAPTCVILDKLDKIGAEAVVKELTETLGLPRETAENVVKTLSCKTVEELEEMAREAIEVSSGGDDGDNTNSNTKAVDDSSIRELKELFKLAEEYGFGDWLQFDASVVRGLAYYTGVVFEAFDKAGELRAIAGGGRYDKLLSLYGATTPVPACGFGFGDCVIVELLKEKNLLPNVQKRVDFCVCAYNKDMQGKAMKAAGLLRQTSPPSNGSGGGGGGSSSNDDDGDGNINSADENKRLVVVDVLLEPKKKVAQTFDYANRIGARYVVFVAPSEWENGCVRIKDLRAEEYAEDDADKQVDVKIEDLWNALEQMRENENRVRARRGFASL
jgi:histidyl-tRNA synthetase